MPQPQGPGGKGTPAGIPISKGPTPHGTPLARFSKFTQISPGLITRMSQIAVEVLYTTTSGVARTSQVAVEVLYTNTAAKARVSQQFVEAIVQNTGNLRVSQQVVEVLISSNKKSITPTFHGTSSLAISINTRNHLTVAFHGTSSILTSIVPLRPLSVTFTGTSTLTEHVTPLHRFTVTFAGTSTLSETVKATKRFTATFAGTSTFTANVTSGPGFTNVPVTFHGTSTFTENLQTRQHITVTFHGTSTFVVGLAGMLDLIGVAFHGTSTFGVNPLLHRVSFNGTSTFVPNVTNFVALGVILSQATVEIVRPPAPADVRLSQATVEVVYTPPGGPVRESQTTVEVAGNDLLNDGRPVKLSQVTVELVRKRGNINVKEKYDPLAENHPSDSTFHPPVGGGGSGTGFIEPETSIMSLSAIVASLHGGHQSMSSISLFALSDVTTSIRRTGTHPDTIISTSDMFVTLGGGKKLISGPSVHSTSGMAAVLKKSTPFFVTLSGGTGEGDTMTIVVTP